MVSESARPEGESLLTGATTVPREPDKLPHGKLILFALGQFGWSLASFGVSNLLNYFYMPPEKADATRVFPAFIFQGNVLWIFTLIGAVAFVSRLFDGVTNPLIASWSDRSRSRLGRRRFFMAVSALPFALFSVLVFMPPQSFASEPSLRASAGNTIWITVTSLLFYFFFVMYNAPYNALISELGHNPKERLNISTVISVTWALGFLTGNSVYMAKDLLAGAGMGQVQAFQAVQGAFAALAFGLMMLPVLFIDEPRYAAYGSSDEGTLHALGSSLKNKNFFRFLVAEFLYWVAQTVLQTGIVYFVVTLLGLGEEMTSTLMTAMFLLSFAFYPIVVWWTNRAGKKKVLVWAFALFSLDFLIFALMGVLKLPSELFAWIAVVFSALPMAIFGILPNAVVADIAEADGIETGNFKAGMFFGVRTFETNLGISVANVLFPSLLTLGMSSQNPFGIRMTAIVSLFICVGGMLVFLLYNEASVMKSLAKKEKIE
jgi:glycoside/pentoside/hexuronide:cation symporter, GPH family